MVGVLLVELPRWKLFCFRIAHSAAIAYLLPCIFLHELRELELLVGRSVDLPDLGVIVQGHNRFFFVAHRTENRVVSLPRLSPESGLTLFVVGMFD